jgi:hypothetical protein
MFIYFTAYKARINSLISGYFENPSIGFTRSPKLSLFGVVTINPAF